MIQVNGKTHLMTALILVGEYPTFLVCLADLRLGGPGFDPSRPAATSSTLYEAKTTPVVNDEAKEPDTLGQVKI